MKSFVVYHQDTGVITKAGRCPDKLLKYQAGTNEKVLEGVAKTDGSQMVVAGAITDTPGWTPPAAAATPELSPAISELTAVEAAVTTVESNVETVESALTVATVKLATIAEGADVTASNTAAAITEQGALATKSAVDLSTSEVTNKSLANLDSAADTKLSGIEAGADVTATSAVFIALEERVTALEGTW